AKKTVEEETGDLFFSLICLTNSIGIDLEAALLRTLNKYSSR
ncbi:MAG: MazG nucleotide pyrophosphohydrolase domain-containing protein, partial [Candidatus Hodarchaeota archaeon]